MNQIDCSQVQEVEGAGKKIHQENKAVSYQTEYFSTFLNSEDNCIDDDGDVTDDAIKDVDDCCTCIT